MITESELTTLLQQLRAGEIAIEEAIETDDLPKMVLHRFSSDCTERALKRQQSVGKEPDERSWTALEAKRAWLLKKIDDEQLAAEFVAVMSTSTTTAWGVVRQSATNSARNSVRAVLETATSSVIWENRLKAKAKEEKWTVGRLAWLLELWQEHGEEFVVKLTEESAPTPSEELQIEYSLA